MSTIAEPKTDIDLPAADDPFYYGFRDEPIMLADGTTRFQRIALTLDDHLHPHEGDQFVEGNLHDLLRSYLRDVCRARLENDLEALVLSDTAVYWDDEELGYHAPDVAVIFGVKHQCRSWKSFDVAKEKVRPRLIIELVTPRYRKTDVVEKFRDYHLARVRTFVILDRERDESPWTIKAYLWNPDRYVLQPLEDDGRFWLEDLNLWIGVDGDNIRCYDGDTDEVIGDYPEVLRARAQMRAAADAEKVRADAEKVRADAAETRLRELEAEITRLKGQPPTA